MQTTMFALLRGRERPAPRYVLDDEHHVRMLRGMVLAHLGRLFGYLRRIRCSCGGKGLLVATLATWQYACPHCGCMDSGVVVNSGHEEAR